MELLTTALIAVACGFGGGYLASRGHPKPESRPSTDARAQAYCNILDALVTYERACSAANDAALLQADGQASEDMKRAISEAAHEVILLELSTGFMLQPEMNIALHCSMESSFGLPFDERISHIREVRETVYRLASMDVGATRSPHSLGVSR
jgi:hypothetical protein